MYNIIHKQILAPKVFSVEIMAPEIARKAQAGQFVMVKIDEKGERIPLTIAETDVDRNAIKIIFQVVGRTTQILSQLEKGAAILDLLGPLGRQTELKNYGEVVVVGGGVGIAELYPLVKALKELGNKIYSILGARTKSLVILEDQLKKFSDVVYITTDDGTYGEKGLVTDVLNRLMNTGLRPGLVYAIGPTIMMQKVSELTKQYGIKTVVNLNPIMVDGTGMCGSCRVTVNGEVKFACVDGPEFDAHQVDFAELINRQRMFIEQEKIIREADLPR